MIRFHKSQINVSRSIFTLAYKMSITVRIEYVIDRELIKLLDGYIRASGNIDI